MFTSFYLRQITTEHVIIISDKFLIHMECQEKLFVGIQIQ